MWARATSAPLPIFPSFPRASPRAKSTLKLDVQQTTERNSDTRTTERNADVYLARAAGGVKHTRPRALLPARALTALAREAAGAARDIRTQRTGGEPYMRTDNID